MTTAMTTIPTELTDLDHAVHRNELKANGIMMAQIRAAERAGHLCEFRKDFFGPLHLTGADAYRQLVETVRAYRRLPETDGLVVGGRTAAQLHRLLPPNPKPTYYRDPIIFRNHAPGARSFHRAAAESTLDSRPRITVRVDGIDVTTVARTLIDLLEASSWRSHEAFVVVGDQALRESLTTTSELETETALLPANTQARVRRALADLDARATTPAQSRSRLLLAAMGLPVPQLHLDIVDDDGTVVATPPFVWPAYRVAGFCEEVDDYCDLTRRDDGIDDEPRPRSDRLGPSWQDPIRQDPLRHDPAPQTRTCTASQAADDRLRELGYQVFRWTGDRIDGHPCDPCNLRRALKAPLPPRIEDPFAW